MWEQECAERVFTSPEVGGSTWSSLASLRACIGDIDANVANPIFEAEMARQRGDEETGEVSSCSRAAARVQLHHVQLLQS